MIAVQPLHRINTSLSRNCYFASLLRLWGKSAQKSNYVYFLIKQECIPVGCVLPAHWLYLRISSYPTHAPREQPRIPPGSNHACPPEQPCTPPQATTHASLPQQPHMPPQSNHTCPPRATMHPHPHSNHTWPPRATTHAPQSNHACPPGATTHPPGQPCTLRGNHTCPPWTEWMTDTCKNITFANYVCGR